MRACRTVAFLVVVCCEAGVRVSVAADRSPAHRVGGVCGIAPRVVQRGVAGASRGVVTQQDSDRLRGQSAQLTEIEASRPDQAAWSFSSQQATLRRLNRAFAGFFRRVKPSPQAWLSPVQGRGSFNSVEWPKDGDGARWQPEARARVSARHRPGQGRPHREVQGRVKTIQIKRQGHHGCWCSPVMTSQRIRCRPPAARPVIDVGIAVFATLRRRVGRCEQPSLAGGEETLTAALQRLQRAKRGSNNRYPAARYGGRPASQHRQPAKGLPPQTSSNARKYVTTCWQSRILTDREHAASSQACS